MSVDCTRASRSEMRSSWLASKSRTWPPLSQDRGQRRSTCQKPVVEEIPESHQSAAHKGKPPAPKQRQHPPITSSHITLCPRVIDFIDQALRLVRPMTFQRLKHLRRIINQKCTYTANHRIQTCTLQISTSTCTNANQTKAKQKMKPPFQPTRTVSTSLTLPLPCHRLQGPCS